MNILKIFPSAEEVRMSKITPAMFDSYIFERELEMILNYIANYSSQNQITVKKLSNLTKEYLIEQGYTIIPDNCHYIISWEE